MSFEVHTGELRGYADMLARNSAYPDAMWKYADPDTELSGSTGGLLNEVSGANTRVRTDVQHLCASLRELLHDSGQELKTAAAWYDRADKAAVERIDKLNQTVTRLHLPPYGRAQGRFADVEHPPDRLNGPGITDRTDPVQPISDYFDLWSPSAWAAALVETITGWNVFDEVGKFFAGDWEAWSKAGSVWGQVGEAMSDLAANIRQGNADLDGGWNGDAADAAFEYFARLAEDVAAQKVTFDALKSGYEYYSAFAFTTASAVVDSLKILFDELAAATFGGPAAEVMAALETPRIIKLCNAISNLLIGAKMTAGMINALIIFYADSLFQNRVPLPGQGYDLKGV